MAVTLTLQTQIAALQARINADVVAQEASTQQWQDQLTERLHHQQLRVFHRFDF